MANTYSIPHNFDQEIYSPDFQLVNSALAYKQTAYNKNKAELEMVLSKLPALKVARDVDKEYVAEKMKKTINLVNRYAGMDLSDNNFADSVMSNAAEFLDDNVKSAVLSARKIYSEEREMADKKKNGKGTYSSQNHAYAVFKSDRSRYLNSEEIGDEYKGGFNYTDYVDVNKIIYENMPKLADQLKIKFVQNGKVGSFMYTETGTEVPKHKVAEVLDLLIDPTAKEQLKINAWSTYGNASDELLASKYEDTLDNKRDFFKGAIEQQETELIAEKDPDKKEKIKAQIEQLENQYAEWDSKDYYDDIEKEGGKESIYTQMYETEFRSKIIDAFSTGRVVENSTMAQAYNESVKFKYQQERDLIADSFRKLEIDAKNKKAEDDSKAKNAEKSLLGTVEVEKTPEGEKPSVAKQYQEELDKASKDLAGMISGPLKLTDVKQAIEDLADPNKSTITFNGAKYNKSDKEMVKAIMRYEASVLQNTKADTASKNLYERTYNKIIFNLTKIVDAETRGVSGMSAKEFPNFLWEYNEQMQRVPTKKGVHNYEALILKQKNGTLTKAQKATLRTYVIDHIAIDPDIAYDKTQKEVLIQQNKQKVMELGVSEKEYKKGPQNLGEIQYFEKGSAGRKASVIIENKWFSDRLQSLGLSKEKEGTGFFQLTGTVTQLESVDKLRKIYQKYRGGVSMTPADKQKVKYYEGLIKKSAVYTERVNNIGKDYYLTELSGNDMSYTKKNQGMRAMDMDKVFNTINSQYEEDMKPYKSKLNSDTYIAEGYQAGSQEHTILKSKIQSLAGYDISDTSKGIITPVPAFKDGKIDYEGIAKIVFVNKKGQTQEMPVSMEYLRKQNIKFKEPLSTPYNADFKEDAATINLGLQKRGSASNDYVAQNFDYYRAAAEAFPTTIKPILQMYNEGGLRFKIAYDPSINGYSGFIYTKEGQLVGKTPQEDRIISVDSAAELVLQAQTQSSLIMRDYLKAQLGLLVGEAEESYRDYNLER